MLRQAAGAMHRTFGSILGRNTKSQRLKKVGHRIRYFVLCTAANAPAKGLSYRDRSHTTVAFFTGSLLNDVPKLNLR